jgi:hypothetical protein
MDSDPVKRQAEYTRRAQEADRMAASSNNLFDQLKWRNLATAYRTLAQQVANGLV